MRKIALAFVIILQFEGAEIMDWKRTPKLFRERVRRGEWTDSTSGICPEFVQANLVVVTRAFAFDFLLFCTRNPKPCPLLEVTEPGMPILKEIAFDSSSLKCATTTTTSPSFLDMMRLVSFARIKDLKVSIAIIRFYLVLVMNYFTRTKSTPYFLLSLPTMN